MPKSNKPPKYAKMKKYAVVYLHGKPRYLGLHGSPESKIAYSRIIAELQANPASAVLLQQKGGDMLLFLNLPPHSSTMREQVLTLQSTLTIALLCWISLTNSTEMAFMSIDLSPVA